MVEIEKPFAEYCKSSDTSLNDISAGIDILQSVSTHFSLAKYGNHASSCGKTEQVNVERRRLMEALKDRKLKLDDFEVRQMLDVSMDSVICVVVSVIRTTEQMEITKRKRTKIAGDLTTDMNHGTGELSFKVVDKHSKKISIPPTVIAYEVCELQVTMPTGAITLMIEHGLCGGFIYGSSIDGCFFTKESPSAESYIRSLYETYEEMTEEEKGLIKEGVLAKACDVDIICTILRRRADFKGNDGSKSDEDQCDSIENGTKVSRSTSPDVAGHDPDFTPTSNDDVTLTTKTNQNAGSCYGEDDSDSTIVADHNSSELPPPTNDDVTSPITEEMKNQLHSSSGNVILALTRKPVMFQRLLQEVLGWKMMSDGTMIHSDDKGRMDLFEDFFELLKSLHHEQPDVVDNIASLSSSSKDRLWQKYRQRLAPLDDDSSGERKHQMAEDDKKIEVEIDNEEAKVDQLSNFLNDSSNTKYAVFSVLLALC